MKASEIIDLDKDEAPSKLKKDPDLLAQMVSLAISDHKRAWKAGWILNQAIRKEDISLNENCPKICKAIKGKPDNQRRELLKLLEHCDLNEENEGYLFDVAISSWEQLGAQPSSRMVAFRIMLKIARRHKELTPEVEAFATEAFLEGLSPGIRRSVLKRLEQFKN